MIMGCDIHTFVERKLDNKWTLVDQCQNTRNYKLFGKMAGVRGIEKPIKYPKGVPKDLSDGTRWFYEADGSDGHTHSWFNEKEIKELKEWYEKEWDDSLFFTEFGWYILEEDTRLIFWFDN